MTLKNALDVLHGDCRVARPTAGRCPRFLPGVLATIRPARLLPGPGLEEAPPDRALGSEPAGGVTRESAAAAPLSRTRERGRG